MLKAFFSRPKEQDLNAEHPMAVNMLDGFRTEIKKNLRQINAKGHRGWTKLHQYGSAGALQYVRDPAGTRRRCEHHIGRRINRRTTGESAGMAPCRRAVIEELRSQLD